jgi:hypothetical protein
LQKYLETIADGLSPLPDGLSEHERLDHLGAPLIQRRSGLT